MRLVPTVECRPGMILGKPIYSRAGQVLAERHMELNASTIDRLFQMGYEYLYIEDEHTEDIYIEDSINMETRMALRMTLQRILDTVAVNPAMIADGRLSLSRICWDGIHMVMSDLVNKRDDLIKLVHVGSPQQDRVTEHFLQNAINVCVYATSIGISQGLRGKDLMEFSMGALLHDIGNLYIRQDLLSKPAALTPQEFEEVKRHCEVGFELLKNEPGVPMNAALCALMHHERIDGSGYPQGLKGADIHPYARWIGMIDAYDAMTNPRPYRKAMLPHEAMEILFAGAGTLFDYEKVELFRNKVAVFPVGLSVSLNTGEQGMVSKLNRSSLLRPVVRIFNDSEGNPVKPYEIDLSRELNVMIEGIGTHTAAWNANAHKKDG